MVVKLTSIDQFEKVLNDNPNVFVMKHSSTCPISASAYDQFNKFLYERDMDGYYLIVQEERELSDYIADKTGIKHESPQAFYFVNGNAEWDADHENITVASLSKAEE